MSTRGEPDWEVDGEVGVDSFSLEGFDGGDGLEHFLRVDGSGLVEHAAVEADHVDAVLGEHACGAGEGGGFGGAGLIDSPETDGLAVGGEDELAVFGGDEALLAGDFFVEGAEVEGGVVGEGIFGGDEGEPAVFAGGEAGFLAGEFIGFEDAGGFERVGAEDEAVEVAVVGVFGVHAELDSVFAGLEINLAGFHPGEEAEVGLVVGGDVDGVDEVLVGGDGSPVAAVEFVGE